MDTERSVGDILVLLRCLVMMFSDSQCTELGVIKTTHQDSYEMWGARVRDADADLAEVWSVSVVDKNLNIEFVSGLGVPFFGNFGYAVTGRALMV